MSHSTFLVMEFVPIGSLADLMNTAQLKEDFMRPLVRQCLCALQHLHSRGISHRNIRPESILVRSRRPLNIRLCNFGGADRSSNTDPKRNTGEDFVGMDIWALGILTLAAFGCRPGIPPEGSGDYRIASFRNADCLPDFQHLPCAALLDGMLKVDPSSRYSAEECLKDSWLQQAAIKKRRGSLCDISDTRPAKRLKTAGDFSTREYSHDASHYPHRNEATSERATHLHPREEIDSFDADSRTSWPVRVWSTIFGRSHI